VSAVRQASSRKAREVAHPQMFPSTLKDNPRYTSPLKWPIRTRPVLPSYNRLDGNSFVDKLSPIERSKQMSLIRSKHTKPEMLVRRLVHSLGFLRVLRRTISEREWHPPI